jgi:DNA-binding transcriptional MocR family regulator
MDISKILGDGNLDTNASAPLYVQLAERIADRIHDQALPPGAKLLPERELAVLFGVSRTTAINAYRHLEKMSLVYTKIGSGTYVAKLAASVSPVPAMPWHQLFTSYQQTPIASILRDLISPTALDVISLASGLSDPDLYPLGMLDMFHTHVKQIHRPDFGHIPTEGYTPLRRSIAAMLQKRNINEPYENIMTLAGSQQGLYLLSKAFLEPGDYVVVESPTFLGALQAFQSAGARLLRLPASGSLDLAVLEDYLIRYRPKFFYVLPTFQNPSGRVLSLQERQGLLALAARYRLTIVEDDPYGELYYGEKPPLSLKALDTYGGVLYLSTFSKILFPGLRTGWLVAPPEVINRLTLEKQYMDLHNNNLSQWLLHLFLEEGNLDQHLPFVRQEYKKRRDIMANAIQHFCRDKLSFTLPDGGFYLWCTIRQGYSARLLLHEANKHGVSFVPGEAFYPTSPDINQIRLCFTTNGSELLTEGIRRLARALSEQNINISRTNVKYATPPII